MTDRPIIFSEPMVRALLDGHKTQTRRLLYSERKARGNVIPASASMMSVVRNGREVALWPPLGSTPEHYFTLSGWEKVKPGDRLWVRESVQLRSVGPGNEVGITYVADGDTPNVHFYNLNGHTMSPVYKTPPIHMLRAVSRLTLIVTATKIEPLKSLSAADAVAEGVQGDEEGGYFIPIGHGDWIGSFGPRAVFADLWERLHGVGSWKNNPEVVAISFRVVKANIDNMAEAA
jgi:hypothetical protein